MHRHSACAANGPASNENSTHSCSRTHGRGKLPGRAAGMLRVGLPASDGRPRVRSGPGSRGDSNVRSFGWISLRRAPAMGSVTKRRHQYVVQSGFVSSGRLRNWPSVDALTQNNRESCSVSSEPSWAEPAKGRDTTICTTTATATSPPKPTARALGLRCTPTTRSAHRSTRSRPTRRCIATPVLGRSSTTPQAI